MDKGLLHLHNVLRWVILVLLLISLFQAFTKNNGLKKTSLWLLISAHITFLIGIYQWFKMGFKIIQEVPFKDIMKNSALRFWAVEHIVCMLLAVILITVARRKAKAPAYSAAAWLYVIALLLILAGVPWPFRGEGIARPWFPGMDV